jgi:hypothetical protein
MDINLSFNQETMDIGMLGRQGENNETRLVIDCQSVLEEHPDAVIGVRMMGRLPGEKYYDLPVTHEDGSVYTAKLSTFDMCWDGNKEIQLRAMVGEWEKRSVRFHGYVAKSLFDFRPPAGVVSDWLDDLKKALAKADAADENGPVIKDGLWYVWQNGAYVNTGVKAEGVDGAPGKQGEPGQRGEPGKDGVSPTVTVESIEGGHSVYVSDAEGVKSFEVMNGKDGEGGGLNITAKNLLITILRNGVYSTDQSQNIDALEDALSAGGGGGGGEVEPTMYTITSNLTNVTTSNSGTIVEEGESYSATLTADEGYVLDAVTVLMGGVDITETTYANGIVHIAEVTGNVEITASAVEENTGGDEDYGNNGWESGVAYDCGWIDGGWIENDGSQGTTSTGASGFSCSAYLPCHGADRIATDGLYSNYTLYFYDADKNFLRKSETSYVVDQKNIWVPDDAYYVRTNKRNNSTTASITPYRDQLLDENTAWEANTFYRLNWADGMKSSSNGGFVEGGDGTVSDFVLCYGATEYLDASATRHFINWYDADKQYINYSTRQNTITALEIPEGASYFRVQWDAADYINLWVKLS